MEQYYVNFDQDYYQQQFYQENWTFEDSNDSNEEMISEDAYYFLQKFYEEHPEYSKNKLFVVGESYGGHYAPAIAHKVYMKNKFMD